MMVLSKLLYVPLGERVSSPEVSRVRLVFAWIKVLTTAWARTKEGEEYDVHKGAARGVYAEASFVLAEMNQKCET